MRPVQVFGQSGFFIRFYFYSVFWDGSYYVHGRVRNDSKGLGCSVVCLGYLKIFIAYNYVLDIKHGISFVVVFVLFVKKR